MFINSFGHFVQVKKKKLTRLQDVKLEIVVVFGIAKQSWSCAIVVFSSLLLYKLSAALNPNHEVNSFV